MLPAETLYVRKTLLAPVEGAQQLQSECLLSVPFRHPLQTEATVDILSLVAFGH